MSKPRNANYVKDLIGECFALQTKFSETKQRATNEYRIHKSSKTRYCVSLIPISNEDAFERNHRRVPYIREMIELMSQSVDGEALLCRYLAKNYTDAYVAIGQELGLGLDGVMTEI